jgi:hypothetical protein
MDQRATLWSVDLHHIHLTAILFLLKYYRDTILLSIDL